jgi:ATP-grasp domain-containing protein
MTWDLRAYRLVTASAYPGMMAPLTDHESCICVLSGDAEPTPPGGAARLSLEELDGVRRRWRFGDVSRLSEFVPTIIDRAPADDRPILLIPPRSSAKWEEAAAAWPGAVRIATTTMPAVDRIAEDKIYVRSALRHLGVPVPDSLVLRTAELDFFRIRELLGAPFVLQSPNGAGGQGTFLITDHGALAMAVAGSARSGRWLVSRFAGRTTINVAGVVHVDGVRLFPASLQVSGVEELGSGFGAYCGSDFSRPEVDDAALRDAYRHIAVIGDWLRRMGHRGVFGADVAVHDDQVAFLEVNPRIQGSSWLLSKLQRQVGLRPCLEEHVEAVLGRPLGASLIQPEPVPAGSHLLMRWRGDARVVGFQSAVYEGVTARPAMGVLLHSGALTARIEADRQLTTGDGHGLMPDTLALVERIRASVGVTDARVKTTI